MNETQIRAMVQSELASGRQAQPFALNQTQHHAHTGTDSPKVNSRNIVPGLNTTGSVSFTTPGMYKFNVNFTPSSVRFYGTVTNSDNWNGFVFGQAALGANLYSAQQTNDTILINGNARSIVQSCAFLAFDIIGMSTFTFSDAVSEEIIHLERTSTGTVFASAVVESYGQNFFTLNVQTLVDTWEINGNFFVT